MILSLTMKSTRQKNYCEKIHYAFLSQFFSTLYSMVLVRIERSLKEELIRELRKQDPENFPEENSLQERLEEIAHIINVNGQIFRYLRQIDSLNYQARTIMAIDDIFTFVRYSLVELPLVHLSNELLCTSQLWTSIQLNDPNYRVIQHDENLRILVNFWEFNSLQSKAIGFSWHQNILHESLHECNKRHLIDFTMKLGPCLKKSQNIAQIIDVVRNVRDSFLIEGDFCSWKLNDNHDRLNIFIYTTHGN